MIISGFAGIGKTYLGNKYSNIVDLESSDFKWIYPKELKNIDKEKRKGILERHFNPDWPENYIEAILSAEKEYDIVLISQSIDVLAELRLRRIPFVVAIPELGLKEEYKKRCIDRGNNEIFVGFVDSYYEYLINKLMGRNDPKLILGAGEYLEDALINQGYLEEKNETS